MSLKNIKSALTIILSVLLALFFMWIALRDLDFNKIKTSLFQANYLWVFVSVFFGILAYGFRAVDGICSSTLWATILNSNAFWTIAFGYMMNLTIPRSGELARATAYIA